MGEDIKNNNSVQRFLAMLKVALKNDKGIEMPASVCQDWAVELSYVRNVLASDFVVEPLDQLIGILTTPVAKRNGVVITASACVDWAQSLESWFNKLKADGVFE